MRRSAIVLALFTITASPCAAQVALDLTTATLRLDDRSAVASLVWPDGTAWPSSDRGCFVLET
ncbi:MAG: hypothetical protein JJ992_23060, partial [Planctomycetes bacterium]|nr:hypothetical protein [Planctomycetota bacterium]